MTPQEATDLAARTLAAIDTLRPLAWRAKVHAADRDRVVSDLAGIEDHHAGGFGICLSHHSGEELEQYDCPDAARYAAGLARTAALYGVTP